MVQKKLINLVTPSEGILKKNNLLYSIGISKKESEPLIRLELLGCLVTW